MKLLRLALCAGAATIAMGGAALADDAPTIAFNVGVTSDYVFRGVSQTNEGGAVQGGVDISGGVAYAGVWASNVDFGNSTDAEVDLYAGVKPVVGKVTFDLGVIYYGYVNAPAGSKEAYTELKAAASMPLGKGTVGAAAYYSPNFFGGTDTAVYYELNGSLPLNDKTTVSGAVGFQDVKYAGDYSTWNLGLTYAITPHVGIDVRYWDTDEHGFGSIYGSRATVGLKATF